MNSKRTARLVVGGLLGLVVVVAVAVAGVESVTSSANSRADKAKAQLADTTKQLQSANSRLTDLQYQVDRLKGDAASVAAQKQQLDLQAAQQAQQAQSLQQKQAAVDASTFGDGLYQVGKDITPGTYHTSGDTHCYWAKLHSSDTGDIITNNLSAGPQTVTVNSPFFITNNCGTWTKV